MKSLLGRVPWLLVFLAMFVAYPLFPSINEELRLVTGQHIGSQLPILFIYGILALALNAIIGYTGIFHLGIGAFFGIGAFVTGILVVKDYPFQFSFLPTILAATLIAAAASVALSAPVLRLRGDYLALVTLGFGEVVRFALTNLEEITGGTQGLKPIYPEWATDGKAIPYQLWYFVTFAFLIVIYLLLGNLERSRLGRGWVALREDELAASCMGLNTAKLKLLALAIGGGIAGLAGSLFAYWQANTSDPAKYGFSTSIMTLCCLILGGLGNRNGVLLGVVLVIGLDQIFSPILDSWSQAWMDRHKDPTGEVYLFTGVSGEPGSEATDYSFKLGNSGSPYLKFSGWRLILFGLILVVVMRLRPEGFLPARRDRQKKGA